MTASFRIDCHVEDLDCLVLFPDASKALFKEEAITRFEQFLNAVVVNDRDCPLQQKDNFVIGVSASESTYIHTSC